ncbi:MAG: ABC transporter ATP-binding protein/permease [Coriobacteriia bacterium]|nr:ABC transporter ATP-binding protein/permease [Coriobacteriia bacterium]
MFRLARFMKPFLGSVALALLLLFVQALCDLNLPNLMSNIVNVGIQQGGVEDRHPVALSAEGYELVSAFMNENQRGLLKERYQRVLPGDLAPDGLPWSSLYPHASPGGFYVFKDGASFTHLDEAFGLSVWTMIGVLQELSQNGVENLGIELAPEALKEVGWAGPASVDMQSVDFAAIYEIVPLVELIPPNIMALYQAQAGQVDELMRSESATMLVRNFYVELGVNMEAYEMGYIVRVGLIMLLITVIGGVATVLVGLLSSRAGAGLARDLRSAIFSKVMSFSHTEFDRFSTASLITRSTNDVTQIQTLVSMGIRMIFYAPIMGVGAIIMALQKSVSMSWIMGIAVLFMLGMVAILLIIVMPKFKIIQKLIDRLNLVARESLNGQMVIRAFSRAPFEMERFDKANLDVTKTNLFIQRAMVFMMPVLMVFMNMLTVLIIWIGAEQVAASNMQVGDMMAYMQYAMMVVMSFMFIAMAFIFVPRAAVSAGRIADVLETKPLITNPSEPVSLGDKGDKGTAGDREGDKGTGRLSPFQKGDKRPVPLSPSLSPAVPLSPLSPLSPSLSPAVPLSPELSPAAPLSPRIEFSNVSFSFEGSDAPALQDINFVAEPGQTTAIIGSTGSGKSTLLSLIMRFYDVDEGTVYFNDIDVRRLSISELRSKIGYVPQKSLLMSGTVADNIAYGNPCLAPEELVEAAQVAQALEFIKELECQGDKGTGRLSPFQKGDKRPVPLSPSLSPLPPGFDFEIAQGGSNVSGGQRQRLAIARALAIKPEVFLFDDSFSALDFATDAALRKALFAYTKDATFIVVAQRVSTIMHAESIYVLDEGRVIAQGTHSQLLKSCPTYREVAETQLSPEEIEAALKSGGDTQ